MEEGKRLAHAVVSRGKGNELILGDDNVELGYGFLGILRVEKRKGGEGEEGGGRL